MVLLQKNFNLKKKSSTTCWASKSPQNPQRYPCTTLGVTCDQLDKISPPASQHVTWDKPEISANCQNLPKGIVCRRYLDPAGIATFSDIKYIDYSFIQELSSTII